MHLIKITRIYHSNYARQRRIFFLGDATPVVNNIFEERMQFGVFQLASLVPLPFLLVDIRYHGDASCDASKLPDNL